MKRTVLRSTALLCAAVMLASGGTVTASAEKQFDSFFTEAGTQSDAYDIRTPSDKIINEAAKKAVKDGSVCIALRKDNSYSFTDAESANHDIVLTATASMLNKRFYEEMGGAGYFGSYDEFRKSVLSQVGAKSEADLKVEPYFVFMFAYRKPYGEDSENRLVTDEKAAEKALRRMFELAKNKSGFNNAISKAFGKNAVAGAYADCSYNGRSEATLDIRTTNSEFKYSETVKLSSETGFYIYNTFVPKDTKKLVISSRDEGTVKFLTDFIPDDCVWVCSDDTVDFDDCVFDMKEIQNALPDLKELYMYQARVTNEKYIGKMTKLEALSYYPLAAEENYSRFIEKPVIKNPPFRKLKKLKKLWLYGEYSDYSFLEKMTSLKSVYAELRNEKAAPSLFGSKCVTKLYIQCPKFDMTGIKNMTGLKELEIDGYACVDAKAISGIKNLRKLKITASGTFDLSALAKCAKLEDLSLNGAGTKDWSFLKKMKKLDTLFLGYIDVKDSDIKGLGVKNIALYYTKNSFSVLSELPKLERADVTGLKGSINDFKGSKTLKTYYETFGEGGDYAVLAKCPKLEDIGLMGCTGKFDIKDFVSCKKLKTIYLNGTSITNGGKLAEIKTLRSIAIFSYDADPDLADKLKKALPKCEIEIKQEQFFQS
ncbi:MAG: hypothetical protein IK093_10800 [Ruminiclostridium sp.]|nr:hypothetical protein [Ruminiclostridium sp.]